MLINILIKTVLPSIGSFKPSLVLLALVTLSIRDQCTNNTIILFFTFGLSAIIADDNMSIKYQSKLVI